MFTDLFLVDAVGQVSGSCPWEIPPPGWDDDLKWTNHYGLKSSIDADGSLYEILKQTYAVRWL